MADRQKSRVTILSPVHSFEGGVRVIRAGANELYCGVTIPQLKDFVLYRGPQCEIPTYHELKKLVDYARRHRVKVVVTVNRPFMVEAMEAAMQKHISTCLKAGVDGLIIGDLGVLSIVQQMKVNTQLYASTYLVTMNSQAVKFLEELGFNRVILDRQLTLSEIAEIARHSTVEVEVFIHGGGCSNTNGNCYLYHFQFSAMTQANLAHPGLIKNPCSLPFTVYNAQDESEIVESVPILDAFEFCSLCKLPELVKSGVSGLKIEGRGDPIWCQESATKVYRELVDLLINGQDSRFYEKLKDLRSESQRLVINSHLPNLKAFYCEQKRCYYSPLAHAPYKHPVSWQAWTKAQFLGGNTQ
jgi:putative protease